MKFSTIVIVCFIVSVQFEVQQAKEGFISLDCGTPPNYSYTNETTGIVYISDASYIDDGTSHNISSAFNSNTLSRQFSTLRSFPLGIRNCYDLKAVNKGYKYIVRAYFLYGDYDRSSKNESIQFDLYLGPYLWKTMVINDAKVVYKTEIITVALANLLSVCLVNTGTGTPFISSLELRPLDNNLYPFLDNDTSFIEYAHFDLGSARNKEIRYPEDPYDRIWVPWSNAQRWTSISTTSRIQYPSWNDFRPPSEVLQTAVTPVNSNVLYFDWIAISQQQSVEREKHKIVVHFAELFRLQKSQSRSFLIYFDDTYWAGPLSPSYLLASSLYNRNHDSFYHFNYTFVASNTSTLPPILNAVELYIVLSTPMLQATYAGDVDAIMKIKEYFQMKTNWTGDPCAPQDFAWDTLVCTYSAYDQPRITTLNLSSRRLSAGIPSALGDLSALQFLDLSDNNLTGQIPESLGSISSLKLLNLSGNQLTGPVPPALLQKEANGQLILSVSINQSCIGACTPKRKLSRGILAIVVLVPVVILLTVAFLVCKMITKRRLQGKKDSSNFARGRSFTYSELEKITNSFERVIGSGGFGTVYYGTLENGEEVAVKKLSLLSDQGTKEFLAEVQLLTRIHHRNLVSLIGYSINNDCVALVYEYMVGGNLRNHLKDVDGSSITLSWEDRLQIALQAAQGLYYLHKGCTPPIIHRDIKTTNILLNEKLEAKLADFGLARLLPDGATHLSTGVCGTPGYLDPEYNYTHQLNEKTDVFSFGVVVLEVITGRPAILTYPEPCHVIQWVRPKLARGNISEVIDRRLQGDYEANSAWKVADIAMRCTLPASARRPTMTDVVIQLKEAVDLAAANFYTDVISAGQTFVTEESFLGPSLR